jgi:hypothetical protein
LILARVLILWLSRLLSWLLCLPLPLLVSAGIETQGAVRRVARARLNIASKPAVAALLTIEIPIAFLGSSASLALCRKE